MTETTRTAHGTHLVIEPKVIYPGCPVALISSTNPDGTANLAPMSSFWALGWTALLGFGRMGQTCANLERTVRTRPGARPLLPRTRLIIRVPCFHCSPFTLHVSP